MGEVGDCIATPQTCYILDSIVVAWRSAMNDLLKRLRRFMTVTPTKARCTYEEGGVETLVMLCDQSFADGIAMMP